jgi:hypothetical protein
MPRTEVIAQVTLGSTGDYSVADAADIVFGLLDQPNQNEVTMLPGEKLLLLVTAEFGATLNIDSVNDPFGRQEDVNYGIGNTEFAMFGPFDREGWKQTNGKLNFGVNSGNVTAAVIRVPG